MTPNLQAGGRPPFVTFETRSVEDRKQTEAVGHPVFIDEDYAVIWQSGAKDNVEKNAVMWLDQISKNPAYEPVWVANFKAAYSMFKQGKEPTPHGMHISSWAAISKAQADTMIATNVLTVEDLAAANDDTLRRIGMGSRELQNKARAWLQTAKETGKTAEELVSLRAQNAAQELALEQLREEVKALAAQNQKHNKKEVKEEDFLEELV